MIEFAWENAMAPPVAWQKHDLASAQITRENCTPGLALQIEERCVLIGNGPRSRTREFNRPKDMTRMRTQTRSL